jgi:hypothetical protein
MSSYRNTSLPQAQVGGFKPKYNQRSSNKPKHGQYIDPAKFVKAAIPMIVEKIRCD